MELDIQALQEAFDVEPISKEFFDSYKWLFKETNGALQAFLHEHPDCEAHFKSCQIKPAEFAKRILAQIVFLYFLQRKGWLGVARNSDWGSGDRHFLRTQFDGREKGVSYFRSFLQPLFYEALAYKREHNFYDRWGVRIPFLNGGLFEPWRDYGWQHQPIDFPDELFSNSDEAGVLDIFDRFNFTVQEDDPVEREVAVDPEILGKVFESLIEENLRHATGTYYTPRSVVHYMCQEVLIDYLAERHPNIERDDFAVLVCQGRRVVEAQRYANERAARGNNKRGGLPRAIIRSAAELEASLRDVTVCDPAVGSGAFPLGMLNEIVNARIALDEHLSQSLTEFTAKLHAINHSLYGVDLDGGAVEIAKLRLWLSLVVDEESSSQIQPLPNLDYKMMQGNSLVSHLNGKSLIDQSLLTRQLKWPVSTDDLHRRLVKLQRRALAVQQSSNAITHESRRESQELRREIRRLEDRIAVVEAAPDRSDDGFDLLTEFDVTARTRREFLKLQQQFFVCTDTDEKRHLREQIDQAHDKLVKFSIQQDDDLNEEEKTAALNAFDQVKGQREKSYFLWQLNFNSVFARDEVNDRGGERTGGFDIVIGNPPYVNLREIGKAQKDAIKLEMPEAFLGTADLYTYFYFIGRNILRFGGHLTYITSKTFMRSDFGERLRSMLTSQTRIAEIIDVSEADVFDAIAYPAICRFQNLPPERSTEFRYGRVRENSMLFGIHGVLADSSFRQKQDTVGTASWLLAPPSTHKLMAKLRDSGQTVGQYIKGKMHRGLLTGLNEAFIVDNETRNQLVTKDSKSSHAMKRCIEGSDVGAWKVNWKGKWVIVFDTSNRVQWPWSGLKDKGDAERIFAKSYPAIYAHLLPFRDRAMARLDQGEFWWELRPCSYYSAFEKPKIVWGNLSMKPSFAIDRDGSYIRAPAVCIEGDDPILLAILNSSVCDWYMRFTAAQRANGYLEYRPMYVSDVPMPNEHILQKLAIDQKVNVVEYAARELYDACQTDRGLSRSTQRHVNQLAYDMFGLDRRECKIIERAIGFNDQDAEEDDKLKLEEMPIPKAAIFEISITFPNLNMDHYDFSKLAKDFSECFSRHAVTMPAVWAETEEVLADDSIWNTKAVHIMYEESSWRVFVQVLIVAAVMKAPNYISSVGDLLGGYGNYLQGCAAMMTAVQETHGNHVSHAGREAANDIVEKHCPTLSISDDGDSRMNEFHFDESGSDANPFYASIGEAESKLKQPDGIQIASQPNRNVELHILTPDKTQSSVDITVHSNKKE